MTTDRRAAPLREYESETWADWVRRQGEPKGTKRANKEETPRANEGSVSEPIKGNEHV